MRDSARHYLQTFLSVVQDLSRCLPRRPRPLGLGTLYAGATNICNAKCVFCAYKTSTSPRGHLPFEIFKKAADDYVELGGRSISFTPTVGDPLVDPGLFEKIKYALGLKSIERVNFYTNGILLATNYNYRSLVDLRVPEIHISMPQPERSAYQEIYGVDAYPQLLEGLKLFLEYNRSQGEPCSIQIDFRLSIPASQIVKTADFVAFIQPYLSRKVTMTYMPNYDNWGGMIQEKHLPGAMRMRRIPAVKTVMCRRMEDPCGCVPAGCKRPNSTNWLLVISNSSLSKRSYNPLKQRRREILFVVESYYPCAAIVVCTKPHGFSRLRTLLVQTAELRKAG